MRGYVSKKQSNIRLTLDVVAAFLTAARFDCCCFYMTIASIGILSSDRDRDSNSGKFHEKVSDKDILEAVANHQPAPTEEIGKTVGLS